jgi:hypothetical protein
MLSVPEVATDLGVSVNWVSGRIRRGVIRIDRDPDTGRLLLPDIDMTMRALRQLRTGAIAHRWPGIFAQRVGLAASLNRCRRQISWTVLQSTSVRLGEPCPSAFNRRAGAGLPFCGHSHLIATADLQYIGLAPKSANAPKAPALRLSSVPHRD